MADEPTTTRRCIGSARFGIEPRDAPARDFPVQPSQKDGLGRMCKTHWNEYTAGLARDAKARKADATEATEATVPDPATEEAVPAAARKLSKRTEPVEAAAGGDRG
jgi:hypothetical protein